VGIDAGDHIWCSRYILEVINSYLFLGHIYYRGQLNEKKNLHINNRERRTMGLLWSYTGSGVVFNYDYYS
jgi:hypothetical protein